MEKENVKSNLNVRSSEEDLAVERKFHADNTNPYGGNGSIRSEDRLGLNSLSKQDVQNLLKFSTINFLAFLAPFIYKRIKDKDFKSAITKSELFDISFGAVPVAFELVQKMTTGSKFERLVSKGKILALGAKIMPIAKQAFDTPGGITKVNFSSFETIARLLPLITNYKSDSLDGITVFSSISSFLKVIAGPAVGTLIYNLGGNSKNSAEVHSMMGRLNTASNFIDFIGMFFGGSRATQNNNSWNTSAVTGQNNTININEGVNKALGFLNIANSVLTNNNGGALNGASGLRSHVRGSIYHR